MNGKNLGKVPIREALALANEQELDLVEVAPQEKPPVCILVDYGKYQYEQKKRKKNNKSKSVEWKEIRLTPGTGSHDIETKLKQLRKFLSQGKHVKITVRFRRRQLAHKDEGRKILDQIAEDIQDVGAPEKNSKMEGKDMSIRISPK